MARLGRGLAVQATVLRHKYDAPVPALISGSSQASASGANTALSLTAPTQISFGSASAVGSSSLGLGIPGSIVPSSVTAVASGSLSLTTTSAVASRAAPGWLGMFILDTGGSGTVPTLSGASIATGISGNITLRTLGLIVGSSRAIGRGTLSLSGPSTAHWAVSPTTARLIVPGPTQARLVHLNNTTARLLPKAPLP